MRTFAAAAAFAAMAVTLSACGDTASTSAQLPKPLHKVVQELLTNNRGKVSEMDIYGPTSHRALALATQGDGVVESPRWKHARFYLIVLHGKFTGVASLAGGKPPPASTEWGIWSPQAGDTDDGVGNWQPDVSTLHRFAVVKP